MWCKFSRRFQDACPDKKLNGILLWCYGCIHHCPHPFFPVVFILWHNHLTSFVSLYLLCWKIWLSSPFRCKDSSFFLKQQFFLQKSAEVCSFYDICAFLRMFALGGRITMRPYSSRRMRPHSSRRAYRKPPPQIARKGELVVGVIVRNVRG